MKTSQILLSVLGALCTAAGLSAQPSRPIPAAKAAPDHDDLAFQPTAIVRKFLDRDTGNTVTVTWNWTGEEVSGNSRYDLYTCLIHQEAPPVNSLGYSLYNLEIQGRRWEVEVIKGIGTDLDFISGLGATVTKGVNADGTKTALLPTACVVSGPPPIAAEPPDPARVGYITFTGSDCTLALRSKRLRHGPGMAAKFSHDTTPPPALSGSEN